MPTDPEKINALAIANHAVVMSLIDVLVAKSIMTVDEAKSVINSAVTAIDNMEGLAYRDSAISILRASLSALDKLPPLSGLADGQG